MVQVSTRSHVYRTTAHRGRFALSKTSASNSAFTFGQWQDAQYHGWGSGTRWYLNTAELGFSLGIYCIRNQIDPELAMTHLKQNPGEVF